MNTEDKCGNSNTTNTGAQTTLAGFYVREVLDAARQLQESLSRFLQEDQRYHEYLMTIIKEATGELGITGAEALKNSAEIENLGDQPSQ